MVDMTAVILLAVALLGALLMLPLGLPGTWTMVAAGLVYRLAIPAGGIRFATVAEVAALAVVAELLELSVTARYARRYGGSRRAAWGAVIGGFVGVIVGVPVPIIGPVIAGLLGTFLGALIGELESGAPHLTAARAAIGALLGRVAASTMKVAIGVAIAAWLVVAAIR
jgi:hypothetical protein